MKRSLIPFALLLGFHLSCVNRGFHSTSKASEVDIPRTPVRNQGTAGFCWSYALTGLLEGRHKAKTGQEIDLSEEHLGFWAIAEKLAFITEVLMKEPDAKRTSIMDAVFASTPAQLEGNEYVEGASTRPWKIQPLLTKYGVVPESAFSRKFENDEATQAKFWVEIAERFRLAFNRDPRARTASEISTEVLSGTSMFPRIPPDSFSWNGEVSSPREFYDSLGTPLHVYLGVTAQNRSQYDRLIQAIKLTLAKEEGVAVFVPITDRLNVWDGTFGGGNAWDHVREAGGHVALAVDYRNRGGTLGPSANLTIETEKHPRFLEEIIVKNSWGEGIATPYGLARFPPVAGTVGHFRITKDFLLSVSDSSFSGPHFGALLPRETLEPPLNPY